MIVALVLAVAMPMMAERVTPETARKVAATFLNNNGVKTAQLTDLSKVAGFPNLYIFNAEPGFVVMAADDCVKPILGYSLTGKFVAEGMPENVSSWLQGYSDEIQYAIDHKMKAEVETAKQWNDLMNGNTKAGRATTVVPPLVQTQWNQNGGYFEGTFVALFNNLCPQLSSGGSGGRAVTGCVATAMAQIMKYWDYPAHGIGSHSYSWNNQTLSANFGNTIYDWANMTNTYDNNSSETEKLAVAQLMYHCGVSVNMKYGPESGAVTFDVTSALRNYFNYNPELTYKELSDYSENDWIAMLKAELDANRPLQYRGRSSEGGHSFVCDGYDSDDNFHFNWGWGGSNDGYFSLTNPGGYTTGQAAIFGIKPVNCSAADPTGLYYSQNGRQITLSWAAAEGAASYNIYRNGTLIGNNTAITYEDSNAPYGTNAYYVRSVDASGDLSFSSNIVTATVEYSPESLVVEGLQIDYKNGSAMLQWSSPVRLQYLDYLTFQEPIHYTGGFDRWGARFPKSLLTSYSGMQLSSVATYFYTDGYYTANIYQCTGNNPSGEAVASASNTYTTGWQTITFETPFTIDDTKDLWIVFQCSGITYPTIIGQQASEDGDYCYINNNWVHFNGYAFFISANLTDGNFSYNIYDNSTKIAEGISTNTFSHNTPTDNSVNYYTVKVKQTNSESDASNWVGLTKGTTTINGNLTVENDNMMILADNSTLTVTGTLSNGNAANLVIENGAQLIHSSEGVKAMVKKSIAPYTEGQNDGWNFIASPVAESVTPIERNGLIANEYDLYYYDEEEHHWRNYRKNSFDLTFKQGYLYANNTQTTLEFAGTLTPSNASVSSNTLSYNSNIDFLKGFNLVGNPFACNATLGTTDCYVIDSEAHKVTLAGQNRQIAPCEGVFVKVSEASQTVSFSKAGASKGETISAALDLVVAQGRSTLDRARVRLGEGTPMEKFTLDGDNSTQLTLWQDGQEYAVVYANDKDELPLNFKAAQNGTYTLGIETNSLELEYLHLIDNMTGDNIDLLVTPSYTFDAKTTDYVSRFKLIFKEENKALTGSTTFAYINDGNIIITGANDNVTLQIVDVMGHIIASCGQTRCIPTTGIPAGVYVLRLIDGENVKVQKIVIE